jgi:hypothetical protein
MTDAPRPRWLAFYVGFLDHPNLSGEPYDRRSAFHWLIENAAWKDHKVRTRGGMIELKRGQVLVAREHLAKAWKWSPGKVRLFLSQMVAADMLEMSQSIGHYANVASICNYDKYQTKPSKPEPINQPVKGQSKASQKPVAWPVKSHTVPRIPGIPRIQVQFLTELANRLGTMTTRLPTT